MNLNRLLTACLMLFFAAAAQATTYVYVTNTTAEPVSVSSVQYGDKTLTKGTYWGTYETVIPAFATRKVLWMNRNTGITAGKNFYFDTTVTGGGSTVVLQQRLKGEWVGSSLWHSGKSSTFTNPWFYDRDIHNSAFNWKGASSTLSFKAEATSGYDDLYYVVHNTHQPEPVSTASAELKVLTYNVWTVIDAQLKCERLKEVPKVVQGYDVIVFEEAFDNTCREQLQNDLRAEYPYQTRVVDITSNLLEDGGVFAVSRYPIAREDQYVFPNCNGYVCLSNRGFVYLEILKGGRPYHVFGVHTQAFNSDTDRAVRLDQIRQMADFAAAHGIAANEPVIYAGDMNVDKYATPDDYQSMLSLLHAPVPQYSGHPYSYDPETNHYATDSREYLDYVLTDNRFLNPVANLNRVRIYRSLAPQVWLGHDLSDHYAVSGQMMF